jgi:Protein of unknown function (DUF4031)
MSVYVDRAMHRFGRMVMGHMIADSLDELHAMADAIGLRREWFQGQASCPHYDVSISKRVVACQRGAIACDRHEFVQHLRRIKAAIRETKP